MAHNTFEIKRYSKEVKSRDKATIRSGICFDDSDPEFVKRFSTFEDAKKEIKQNRHKYLPSCVYRPSVIPFYYVEEYGIEGFTTDEDGEFIDGTDMDCAVDFTFDTETNTIVFKEEA